MPSYAVTLSMTVGDEVAAAEVRARLGAAATPALIATVKSLSLSVTALDDEEPVPTAEDDPRLLDVLARAGEEWGPVRVAVTAAVISDPVEVVRALVVTGTPTP